MGVRLNSGLHVPGETESSRINSGQIPVAAHCWETLEFYFGQSGHISIDPGYSSILLQLQKGHTQVNKEQILNRFFNMAFKKKRQKNKTILVRVEASPAPALQA